MTSTSRDRTCSRNCACRSPACGRGPGAAVEAGAGNLDRVVGRSDRQRREGSGARFGGLAGELRRRIRRRSSVPGRGILRRRPGNLAAPSNHTTLQSGCRRDPRSPKQAALEDLSRIRRNATKRPNVRTFSPGVRNSDG